MKNIKEEVLNEMDINTINPRLDCVNETLYAEEIIELTIKKIIKIIKNLKYGSLTNVAGFKAELIKQIKEMDKSKKPSKWGRTYS